MLTELRPIDVVVVVVVDAGLVASAMCLIVGCAYDSLCTYSVAAAAAAAYCLPLRFASFIECRC